MVQMSLAAVLFALAADASAVERLITDAAAAAADAPRSPRRYSSRRSLSGAGGADNLPDTFEVPIRSE